MTTTEAINRGYNLMITAVLVFAGLAFGTVAIEETDAIDKFDDIGLLVIGVIALIWYLWGDHRLRRSQTPVLLAVVALITQLSAIVFERDDATAFGDNIGGIILFTPFVIFVIYQHMRNGRLQASS